MVLFKKPTMRYSQSLRERILLLHQQGHSDHAIGRIVGKRQSCISRLLRKAGRRPCTSGPAQRGRARLLSARDERVLKRLVTSGVCDTAAEIARQSTIFGLPNISADTIRRALRRQGLVARVKPRKPALTKLQRQRRLEWARAHRNCTAADWERVIFSDETKLLCVNPNGRAWCWRPANDHSLGDRIVKPSKKFGGVAVMMWGCMSAKGVGNACRILTTMDSSVYVEILERHMRPSTGWLRPYAGAPYFLQQDNDPKHTSRKTRDWLALNHVAALTWPSQSPDLNPIEQLWATLKRRVNRGVAPTTVDALWERLEQTWWSIEPELCQRLVDSMPARIEAVLKAHGGHTRF